MAFETLTADISMFFQQNIMWIALAGGIIFGFIILFKKVRSIPAKPDYIRIFQDRSIRDEALNKPNRYDPKWLYRGDKKLGRIVTIDTKIWKSEKTKEESRIYGYSKKKKEIEEPEHEFTSPIDYEVMITTIVFRMDCFLKFLWYNKRILRFRTEEATVKDDKIIFDSNVGFTALGNEYTTRTSYPETSAIIEGHYSKRLFEANVNVMAGRMEKISAETPEMAHELNLKRLEIEKIRAEKEKKLGSLV